MLAKNVREEEPSRDEVRKMGGGLTGSRAPLFCTQ